MKNLKLNLIMAALLASASLSASAEIGDKLVYTGGSAGYANQASQSSGLAGASSTCQTVIGAAASTCGSTSPQVVEVHAGFVQIHSMDLGSGLEARAIMTGGKAILLPQAVLMTHITDDTDHMLKFGVGYNPTTKFTGQLTLMLSLGDLIKDASYNNALTVGYTAFQHPLSDRQKGIFQVGFDHAFN